MSEAEWGPWVEHDGRAPNACTGDFIKCLTLSGNYLVGRLGEAGSKNTSGATWYWVWRRGRRVPLEHGKSPVVRYRIRKPRGLTMLEEIARTPKPVDA